MSYTEDKKPQRRYRLNGKKLARTLLLTAFVAAMATAAALALRGTVAEKAAALGGGLPNHSVSAATAALPAQAPSTARETPAPTADELLSGRIVVVDAGHGGFDPGAIGVSGAHEDDINLAVAQELETALEDMGARVIMTREDENAIGTDKDSDMAERRRIIEESGSDIVISIHMNNFKDDPSVSGPLVLFMPGSVKGETLAKAVQKNLNAELDADGQPRSDNLYVLKSGTQPCVLVECGYLSNKAEEEKLQEPDYQKKIAQAICAGAAEFLMEE